MTIASALAAAAALGGAVAWSPLLVLAPLALIGGVLLLASPQFRIGFVVFGGLATLQSSQELNAVKLVYLAGAALALGAALLNLPRVPSNDMHRMAQPLLWAGLLLSLLLLISLPVALASGTPITDWLRDSAPYFLVASVPVFAIDAQRSMSERSLLALYTVAGTLASMSFTVEWLDRRNLADLQLNRIVLPSFLLPASIFSYSVARVLSGGAHRIVWVALASLVFSLLLVTGTRTAFVLLSAPPAAMLAARPGVGRAARRILAYGLMAGLFGLVFTQAVTVMTGLKVGNAADRLVSISQVVRHPASDQSFQERRTQTEVAWETFLAHPLLGAGPGHRFDWVTAQLEPRSGFNIDTSMSFPAKFGIAGLLVAVIAVGAFVAFVRELLGWRPAAVSRAALIGFAAVVLLGVPFGSPFEDKGFSFGLMLLLALALRTATSHDYV